MDQKAYQLAAHQVVLSGRMVEKMLQIGVVQAVIIGNIIRVPFLIKPGLAMFPRCIAKHFYRGFDLLLSGKNFHVGASMRAVTELMTQTEGTFSLILFDP